MKYILLLTLFFLTGISYGKVLQGQNITASNHNSSTFDVGSIQQSVLIESVFQSRNGDCWVLMDGRVLSSSDELKSLTGWSNIPDARGRVLRTVDHGTGVDPDKSSRSILSGNYTGENLYIGSIQNDSFKSHSHTISGNTQAVSDYVGGSGANYGIVKNQVLAAETDDRGGNETRMKNIYINTFIKIKESCSFN